MDLQNRQSTTFTPIIFSPYIYRLQHVFYSQVGIPNIRITKQEVNYGKKEKNDSIGLKNRTKIRRDI
jgi:hypothetical protein